MLCFNQNQVFRQVFYWLLLIQAVHNKFYMLEKASLL
jgi:hypothetical protein